LLEDEGFEIDALLQRYERIAYEWIEPYAPPAVCLSVTVALEHLTATLASHALDDPMLDEAPPLMRDLLRWHACEEIEHKAVAFEVLKRVAPNYPLRIAGMVVGAVLLLFFWEQATRDLLAQDGQVSPERLAEERRVFHARMRAEGFVKRGFLSYLRPDFHPDDEDDRTAAAAWLAANEYFAAG
jgi:predicted metal-dependent hydrolase